VVYVDRPGALGLSVVALAEQTVYHPLYPLLKSRLLERVEECGIGVVVWGYLDPSLWEAV